MWWDGEIVLAAWRIPHGQPLGLSGGHVMMDVLTVAAEAAGYDLYIQACNPACDYGFAHTSLRFIPADEEAPDVTYVDSQDPQEVRAIVPTTGLRMVEYVFRDLRGVASSFTAMKNTGRHILDIEDRARKELDDLLALSGTSAEVALLRGWKRLKGRWINRRWRSDSKRLIAQLWITLSVIERLRRTWDAERFDFEDGAKERGLSKLFERDHADDAARVVGLDLELTRSAMEEVAQRLDSRALVAVTGTATIAGGIAGAIFGTIAAHVF